MGSPMAQGRLAQTAPIHPSGRSGHQSVGTTATSLHSGSASRQIRRGSVNSLPIGSTP
jgi:hypothetical protein